MADTPETRTARHLAAGRAGRSGVETHDPAPVSAEARRARRPGTLLSGIAFILASIVASIAASTGAALPAPAAGSILDRFTGTVEEFYVVPDPLPAGAPGELIRVQDIGSASGLTTVRIMYHSRDTIDRDRAVTGVLTYPTATAPADGYPVLSVAPGTTGLAAPCAMSRGGSGVFTYGLPMVGVRTDYIGLGPVGEIQPYLSRVSEAHAVVDAVRAARNLTEAGAGNRWLAIGGSQGGHSAIAANELGAAYAPELDLLGTVSLAPAAMLDRVYNPIDEIVTHIVGVMALYGATSEHPEIDPDDYVSQQTAATAEAVLPTGCVGEITNAFLQIPPDQFYIHDPTQTEPARSIMLANDVGNVAVDAPLLLVSGTADTRVFIERSRDLFARLCTTGQVTEYTEYEGATHDDIGVHSAAQVTGFLQSRLAGDTPTNTCNAASPTTSTSTAARGTTSPASSVPAASVPASVAAAAVPAIPAFTG